MPYSYKGDYSEHMLYQNILTLYDETHSFLDWTDWKLDLYRTVLNEKLRHIHPSCRLTTFVSRTLLLQNSSLYNSWKSHYISHISRYASKLITLPHFNSPSSSLSRAFNLCTYFLYFILAMFWLLKTHEAFSFHWDCQPFHSSCSKSKGQFQRVLRTLTVFSRFLSMLEHEFDSDMTHKCIIELVLHSGSMCLHPNELQC